jgi:predicted nucleotidyltransferase
MTTLLSTVDITPQHLQMVTDILQRYSPDREVWAYGSRVSGHSWQYSDLDLVIVGEGALDSITLWDLRDAFSESRLPYLVDLKDWHHIPQHWQDEIRRCYAVIHSPGQPPECNPEVSCNP